MKSGKEKYAAEIRDDIRRVNGEDRMSSLSSVAYPETFLLHSGLYSIPPYWCPGVCPISLQFRINSQMSFICPSLSISLLLSLSISIYPSIYLSIYLSFFFSLSLPFSPFLSLSSYFSLSLSLSPFISLSSSFSLSLTPHSSFFHSLLFPHRPPAFLRSLNIESSERDGKVKGES